MMVIATDRGYPDLLESLRGRSVFIWTCNVCAKTCGAGGQDAAVRLADRLAEDGVMITGTGSVSASCLTFRVVGKMDVPDCTDVIVSLTCDAGAFVAAEISGKEVMNPIITIGHGIIGQDGRPMLLVGGKTEVPGVSLEPYV
jgi:hypothetical protein